jgi:hypothetical protein
MSYSLGQGLTNAQANRAMGWSKARVKAYWDARAKACQQFADEGECLEQVARHVPITLAGGMGDTGTDIATALNVTAGLFSDPDGTLRRYGPPIIAAADQHIVDPLVQELGRAMGPYMVKYVLPPLAVLYVISGVSAYYSYKVAKKLAPNPPRRRRRRRRKRRTSRR